MAAEKWPDEKLLDLHFNPLLEGILKYSFLVDAHVVRSIFPTIFMLLTLVVNGGRL